MKIPKKIQDSPWRPTQVGWDGMELRQIRYQHEDGGEAVVFHTGGFALLENPAFRSFSRAQEILAELKTRAAWDFERFTAPAFEVQHVEV